MEEQELPPIQITNEDIQSANQLSLHCPICANPVENHVAETALQPVVCEKCGTLYHKACWEQSGGKCAVLGCQHSKYYHYGQRAESVLQIKYTDLPRPGRNGRVRSRNKQLKHEQRRQVEEIQRGGLLTRLFRWLLDQIKIG